MKKPALTRTSLSSNIKQRWSPRAFDTKKEIEYEKLLAICEAAQWAPSSAGDEPWRFIIFNRYDNEKSWSMALKTLDEYNQVWVINAPVIIACLADKFWRKDRNKKNRWSMHDAGAASENLHLEAVNQGLITHPMGGFNNDEFRTLFEITEEYDIVSMIAVGYPGEQDVLDEFNRKREKSERKRRKLSELFYNSEFGKAYFID